MPYPRQLTLRRRRLHQTYWFRLRRLRVSLSDIARVLCYSVGISWIRKPLIPRTGCGRLAQFSGIGEENHVVSRVLQVAPRFAISPRPSGRQISIRSVLRQRASSPVVINRNTHRIPVPPLGYRPDQSYLPCRHTPILWTVPYTVIAIALFASGLTRSLQFSALNSLAFADVPPEQVHAWLTSRQAR